MKGLESKMGRLNNKLAEAFMEATKPFFFYRKGQSPKVLAQRNFRIRFEGSKNKKFLGPINLRAVNFYVWTDSAEKLLEEAKYQLFTALKENIHPLLMSQLGIKRPLLKLKGFIDKSGFCVSCSIGKNLSATTHIHFN